MLLKLSSIFVCGMYIFSTYVDATPLPDFFKQYQPTDAANLPLAYQISDLLHKAMTLDDSRNEKENTQMSFCQSVLTLTDSKRVETFRLAIAKVVNLISDQNQDAQQIIIISHIFTTLHFCLKQDVAEEDFLIIQKELRDIILRNNERISSTESEIIWKMALGVNYDMSVNLDDDISIDMQQEDESEENHLGLGHEYVPRDLDDDLRYISGPGSLETGGKLRTMDKHRAFSSSNAEPRMFSKFSGAQKDPRNEKFSRFRMPTKPVYNKDGKNRKFLLPEDLGSSESSANNLENKFFLFDNDLPSLPSFENE